MGIFDFFSYCPLFLKIQTKDGQLVPLVLNSYQIKIAQIIIDTLMAGKPGRFIILKGRQMGISTIIAAICFWIIVTRLNLKHILIADVSTRTDDVMAMYRRFLDNLTTETRPMVEKTNEREIVFDNPNPRERKKRPGLKSRIVGETAQDKEAGRGSTCQIAHKTECAYYPYAGEIDKGLGNSVPFAPWTLVVEESTANGVSGHGAHFFNRWTQAVAGLNDYTPIFIPWFEADEYEVDYPSDFELTDAEIDLNHAMDAGSELWRSFSPERKARKLMWRRKKIAFFAADVARTTSPDEVFDQEFPWCPDVAFILSGNPVLNVDKLRKQIAHIVTNPPPQAIQSGVERIFKGTTTGNYSRGLTIFRLPKDKTESFVIGADIAEGLADGDSSHAVVLDSQMSEVAFWHGGIDPDAFGGILAEIGIVYNNALIAPEINSMGHTTLATLKRLNYPRIYVRHETDKITDKPKKELGWRTTAANKNAMIGKLKSYHRDDVIKIKDVFKLREMATINREENGHIEINGKDRTAALCIACEAFEQLPTNDGGSYGQEKKKNPYSQTPEERRESYQKNQQGSYFD